jgi:hypothetical protein
VGSWSFRLRFRVAPTSGLSIAQPKVGLDVSEVVGGLWLEVWPRSSTPISDAEWLVLIGGAESEREAWERGTTVAQALQRAFARLRVAADLGSRGASGRLTEYGKQFFQDTDGRPLLDDEHGLMVYRADPPPRFSSVGAVTPKLSPQGTRVSKALGAAVRQRQPVSEREEVAYNLFAASFFDSSPDARLISLVMAIESLLDPAVRSDAACSHVERLIKTTSAATELDRKERDSLIGSLRWLRQESIRASGAKLVRAALGGRTYGEEIPERLWHRAYDLRSKLVHGSVPRPSRDEVGRCAAGFEVMVADLLSGSLLDVDV